eukprot:COSAG05_NODE_287_length_12131_cov_3.148022_13_plen_137_part_00
MACIHNECACTALNCSHAGFGCGIISDGCGGTVNCGACPASAPVRLPHPTGPIARHGNDRLPTCLQAAKSVDDAFFSALLIISSLAAIGALGLSFVCWRWMQKAQREVTPVEGSALVRAAWHRNTSLATEASSPQN